ncbi:MAG: GAF domain-containing protein [Ignavibacteriaceae bacterium]|nr:GAF domain-containing protein [Ignavibacteriaceae bacterium]
MENLITDYRLSTKEKYELLLSQLESLILKGDNKISSLANLSAALKQSFDKISWVGFYIYENQKLWLGPFQGKVACTSIDIGKGVCGKAAELIQTIIVPDVNKFPGHIFCDSDSKSEIVVPLIKEKKLFGVLDVDSNQYNSFDEVDKHYLEKVCTFLMNRIN